MNANASLSRRPPRRFWGWGLADATLDPREHAIVQAMLAGVGARMWMRRPPSAPDWVAFPEDEQAVVDILDWAHARNVAVIPYGGGSSVCGGVEAAVGSGYAGTVSIDLERLNRVLEVDPISRAARIQAGALGPELAAQLKTHGLTLRHFPQSFEFSSLGGWIATRAGGHYATLYTHIDDFVEATRLVTPAGVMQTRRLPGSGAGPAPDRLVIGSEGTLGVITEAWVRVQVPPRFRASTSAQFDDYFAAVACVRALELVSSHGGRYDAEAVARSMSSEDSVEHRSGAAGAWRDAFMRMPYWRDPAVGLGVIMDTFETAITWDRFETFYKSVKEDVVRAITRATGQKARLSCRFTHLYPDGPAPYFTFATRAADCNVASALAAWRDIKLAANETVVAHGGTITHHHAVGRDHRNGYEREVDPLFRRMLSAAKQVADPQGILNPGVLVDPVNRQIGATGVLAG